MHIDRHYTDPAAAMLEIATARPGAAAVSWVEGTAADLATAAFDLVTMTGHVAQVFLDGDEWRGTLHQIHRALEPSGWFAFETRNPDVEPWKSWNRMDSFEIFLARDGSPPSIRGSRSKRLATGASAWSATPSSTRTRSGASLQPNR